MRFDLHCHSIFSADASTDPDELPALARQHGLDGLAVTDHDSYEAVDYFRAVGLIAADGKAVDGLLIIPGVEVSTADGHLLFIGCELPDLAGVPALEVCHEIHDRGGIAIPAHPYDHWRAGIREEVLDELPIDAIEVFNAAATRGQYNEQAKAYAQRRGLPMTASSDSHLPDTVGYSSTELEVAELSVQTVLEAIRSGRTQLHERALGVSEMLAKSFHNLMRPSRSKRLRELHATIDAAKLEGSMLAE